MVSITTPCSLGALWMRGCGMVGMAPWAPLEDSLAERGPALPCPHPACETLAPGLHQNPSLAELWSAWATPPPRCCPEPALGLQSGTTPAGGVSHLASRLKASCFCLLVMEREAPRGRPERTPISGHHRGLQIPRGDPAGQESPAPAPHARVPLLQCPLQGSRRLLAL